MYPQSFSKVKPWTLNAPKVGHQIKHFSPVKNTAANPLFCTELSERNSSRKEFPSDVMTGGSLDPQKRPCFRTSPEPILELNAKLSYSQSFSVMFSSLLRLEIKILR